MTIVDHSRRLLVVPSVPVWRAGECFLFDRKFFDGLIAYTEFWNGPVTVLLRESVDMPPEFGLIENEGRSLPFGVSVLGEGEQLTRSVLEDFDVVYAAGDAGWALEISQMVDCQITKIVYVVEYTPLTRLQILAAERGYTVRLLWGALCVVREEMKRLKAFKLAHSLHFNGWSVFNRYNHKQAGLFFYDTRLRRSQAVSMSEARNRRERLLEARTLRLVFSGRLEKVKGAHLLVQIGRMLVARNVSFSFDIYGSGSLASHISGEIQQYQLQEQIYLHGAVDFDEVLVPSVREQADLYVLPHIQGDPSCTYAEALCCGIPLVGFANEALSGLLAQYSVGWAVDVGNVEALAAKIEGLFLDRGQLAACADEAVRFVDGHCFEDVFRARVDHLREVCAR